MKFQLNIGIFFVPTKHILNINALFLFLSRNKNNLIFISMSKIGPLNVVGDKQFLFYKYLVFRTISKKKLNVLFHFYSLYFLREFTNEYITKT